MPLYSEGGLEEAPPLIQAAMSEDFVEDGPSLREIVESYDIERDSALEARLRRALLMLDSMEIGDEVVVNHGEKRDRGVYTIKRIDKHVDGTYDHFILIGLEGKVKGRYLTVSPGLMVHGCKFRKRLED